MKTDNPKKFHFKWTEKGLGNPHNECGEEWYETFDEAFARFKQYALEHLTLGLNPKTGANGHVGRTFLESNKCQFLLNLMHKDVLYIAILSANIGDVKNPPSGDITRELLFEKGLIKE